MSAIHVTSQGEALDLICYRHYGPHVGAVEQVLSVNPQIKTNAHRLPLGIEISLPDIQADSAPHAVRLWD